MTLRSTTALFAALACAACSSIATRAPAPSDAAQFERLKSLEGAWVSTGEDGSVPRGAVVRYRVTSAGSALIETLFEGTEHEMVSIYHLDGGVLTLTHYCSMGNQPRMVAEPGDDGTRIRFAFAGGANVDAEAGQYMGAAEFEFVDAARVNTRWTMFRGAEVDHSALFSLVRSWQ